MILWADHNLYLYCHRSCSAVDSTTLTKEHNLVFAHGQDFDFWTGCREFKNARINIKLAQIRCIIRGGEWYLEIQGFGNFRKLATRGRVEFSVKILLRILEKNKD